MGSPHDPVPLSHRPGCGGPRLSTCFLKGCEEPPTSLDHRNQAGSQAQLGGGRRGPLGKGLTSSICAGPGDIPVPGRRGRPPAPLFPTASPRAGQGEWLVCTRAQGRPLWPPAWVQGVRVLQDCRGGNSALHAGVRVDPSSLPCSHPEAQLQGVCVWGGDDRSAPLSLREAAGGAGPYLPTELLPLEKAPQSEDSALWVSGPPPSWPAVIRENLTFPLSGVSPHELSKYGAHLERVWGLCPQTHQQW